MNVNLIYMKKILLVLFIGLISSTYGQENKIEMISNFDVPPFESRDFILGTFLGIDKLDLEFTNSEKLVGKNYKLIIRQYKNGKIAIEKFVIDTKKEKLPKIEKDFKFSIINQQTANTEKITFFFSNFFNKNIFKVNKKFEDGALLLRAVSSKEKEKIEIEMGKETQIALITPPNDDSTKGPLGYCEVSQGKIDIDKWYAQYKLPEFFLIYLVIED